MPFYSASVNAASPGTTNDILTLLCAVSRVALVHEVSVSGEGTASNANELGVSRSTTLGTGTAQTVIVGAQMDPDNAASGLTCGTGVFGTAQPVLAAVPLLRLGCNSNGGVYRWVAKPGEEIRLRTNTAPTGGLSMRFTLGGAQQMGVFAVYEDL